MSGLKKTSNNLNESPTSFLEISKSAFAHNIDFFRHLIPETTKIVAVVKANAYGHGLKETITCIEDQVDIYQIDDIQELRILRKYSNKKTFFFGFFETKDLKEILSDQNLEVSIFSLEHLIQIIEALRKINSKQEISPLKIQIAIDASFGREGFLSDHREALLRIIENEPLIDCTGIYAHFSQADTSLENSKKQLEIFLEVAAYFELKLRKDLFKHISATAGTLTLVKTRELSAIRLGRGLYGGWTSPDLKTQFTSLGFKLIPPLTWKSKVAQVKVLPQNYPVGYGATYTTTQETKVALIPQGYSDGYDRGLSNKAHVLIKGKKCKLLGRVSMNMTVVEVTHLEDLHIGEEVVLIGSQKDETILALEIADLIGSIGYEVISRISALLPRVVVK